MWRKAEICARSGSGWTRSRPNVSGLALGTFMRVAAKAIAATRKATRTPSDTRPTIPIGDELMYVEPVYAKRATASEANFPILRYVLVSYRGGIGLGNTLQSALDAAKENVDEPGAGEPTDGPTGTPTGSPSATPTSSPTGEPGSVDALLERAQSEFLAADAALRDGDLAGYKEHIDKARDYVQQALALEGGGSPAASASASGPSPSP